MKITVTTKAIKSKEKDAPKKAYLCFRLRDKDVDIKVRSDIEVMIDYWDNEFLSYRRTHPPKQPSSTWVIDIMHHLRIVGHWCIRMGFTTNRSCDAFTIPAAVHGSPYYLTLEERDKVFISPL